MTYLKPWYRLVPVILLLPLYLTLVVTTAITAGFMHGFDHAANFWRRNRLYF